MSRILIHSPAPWCGSGYGQQSAQLALRLKAAGHDVEISAFFGLGGSPRMWNGIRVWPGSDDFGTRLLPRYCELLKPDLAVTLCDVWPLQGKSLRGLPLASWCPVDHDPIGERLVEFFRASGSRPVAMSRHGERQLRDADLAPLYVPHAIDTSVFRPRDRADARAQFNVPEDAFLVAMVATNMDDCRKSWFEALSAFKVFHDDHSDAILYMHTDVTGQHLGQGSGHNLAWMCESLGIDAAWLRITDQLSYDLGLISADDLACLYSAADVLLSPSHGEGFGICVIEAQACGTPVIVGDFTAQPELCGAGWIVEGEPHRVEHYRSYWQRPKIAAIRAALEEAYAEAGSLRDAAVEFAQQYDADRVFNEQWLPALAALLVEPARAGNRQARRRAEREKQLA